MGSKSQLYAQILIFLLSGLFVTYVHTDTSQTANTDSAADTSSISTSPSASILPSPSSSNFTSQDQVTTDVQPSSINGSLVQVSDSITETIGSSFSVQPSSVSVQQSDSISKTVELSATFSVQGSSSFSSISPSSSELSVLPSSLSSNSVKPSSSSVEDKPTDSVLPTSIQPSSAASSASVHPSVVPTTPILPGTTVKPKKSPASSGMSKAGTAVLVVFILAAIIALAVGGIIFYRRRFVNGEWSQLRGSVAYKPFEDDTRGETLRINR